MRSNITNPISFISKPTYTQYTPITYIDSNNSNFNEGELVKSHGFNIKTSSACRRTQRNSNNLLLNKKKNKNVEIE